MSADVVEIDLEPGRGADQARGTRRSIAKHARSLTLPRGSEGPPAGRRVSSWQSWPPHPIYVDRGEGSHVWDIDGNDYVDYHNGYGVMVMGHAHPKIVEAVQRARRARHALRAADRGRAAGRRDSSPSATGLPYWRFGNSGTEATLDAVRIMRATHRPELILKIEGTYHGHHDSLMVSVFPSEEDAGPRDHPDSVPQTARPDPGNRRLSSTCRSTTSRLRERVVRRARRRDRRHDRRARHDELRAGAARPRLPRRR